MNKKVFISYAWNDRKLVNKAIKQLKSKGLLGGDFLESINNPMELSAGADIRAALKEQILTCDKVLLIWSGRAASSPWVQYEVGMAEALEKPILIVWADKFAPRLPAEIEGNQIISLDA